jgi:hypothetical protein
MSTDAENAFYRIQHLRLANTSRVWQKSVRKFCADWIFGIYNKEELCILKYL